MDVSRAAVTGHHRVRRVTRYLGGTFGLLVMMLLTTAHVGSPDTWFEGPAGPYKVRVLIRHPPVIPAQAELVVRVTGAGVQQVTATARIWNGGAQGAPPPEALKRVPGDTTLYTVPLWIMRQGSYAVLVQVTGAAGAGTATVPFTAAATAVLGMDRTTGIVLGALGVFLVIGLITIVGAATRESTLPPGVEPDAARTRKALVSRVVATVLLTVILVGGRAWWNLEDRAYARGLLKPTAVQATVSDGAPAQLRLTLDAKFARSTPLIPDHGKLMHLFLVQESGLGALAHLHPVAQDSLHFSTQVPALPPGGYYLFADVVHESGFTETMTQRVQVPAAGSAPATLQDADDAFFVGVPNGAVTTFGDGTTLTFENATTPRRAGEDASLRFVLRDATGAPAAVEPYLGMAGHAVVMRTDASVYVHLHPMGTASMGAQEALEAWTPADTIRGSIRAKLQSHDGHAMGPPTALAGTFDFPYAFPTAGAYRVWVQFRRGGTVQTATFAVTAAPGA